MAKFNSVQVLLSLTANLDWSLQQSYIKNALLNGDFEQEVYMEVSKRCIWKFLLDFTDKRALLECADLRNCSATSSNPLMHGLKG